VLLADWHLDDDFAQGRLVDLFPDHEVTATTFETAAWLLYPSRKHLPLKVRAAIEFLREHVGKPRSARRGARASDAKLGSRRAPARTRAR
jgi:DNA-binding transcriptional LysR family regulator